MKEFLEAEDPPTLFVLECEWRSYEQGSDLRVFVRSTENNAHLHL